MEIISNVALISINETLLVQLICFVVFMFILNRVMIRPLRGARQDRETYIEELGTEISGAQKEMQAIAAQIESQEADARQAAMDLQKEIIDQGNQEAVGILAAAKDEVMSLRRKTNAEIEASLTQFRGSLEKEAETVAVRFMEKALSRRLNP